MSDPVAGGPFSFVDAVERREDVQRLRSLRNTGLLHARQSSVLDSITRLAARTTSASAAAVSLITSDHQVHPSFYEGGGWRGEPHMTPIAHSFCQFVVNNDAPLVVGDATTHPALHDHPAVVLDGVAAYAGYPLHDPDGQVLGALCVIDVMPRSWDEQQLVGLRDLAVAAEMEIALRLSQRATHLDQERLLRILDGADKTMILIADAGGVVVTMNRSASRCLELHASSVLQAWTLADLTKIARPCGPAVARGQAQDWALEAVQGAQRIISVQLSSVHDAHGDIEGYVVVGEDVSMRRQAEQALRETVRKQADAVKRLGALDAARNDFIAVASHELRTPVTSILGYTELLVDGAGGDLTPKQSDLVSRVDRNGRRLLHLVEDLLSLERMKSSDACPVRATFEAASVAHAAWESLAVHLTGRRLATVLALAPESLPIHGDAVQLERALLNLLTNAIKFTPDGGSVRLSVVARGQDVIFEVADTGSGIPADEQGDVCEPFVRTQAAQLQAVPGSGLGLTVARRTAEEHGGRLVLVSEPNHGTTVSMTIPGSSGAAMSNSGATSPRPILRLLPQQESVSS